MRQLPILIILTAMVLAGCAQPLAAGEQAVDLGAHGALALRVPAGWVMDESRPETDLPPTLHFGPEVGDEFVVFLTPMWPQPGAQPDFDSPESIYKVVAAAARDLAAQAAETELEVREFDGGKVGYYFWATDRDLVGKSRIPPGEYLHLTQGAVIIGELLCTFKILTNERPSGIIDAAMMMLRTAAHRTGA